MKIHGKVIENRKVKTVTVRLGGDDVDLKLGAVPISFGIMMSEVLPPPTPPTDSKMARDDKGKLLKHPVTGQPFKRPITDDPAYRRAVAEHGVMCMLYTLYMSLVAGDPEQIQFDIEVEYQKSEKPHDIAFVRALERELSLAGLDLKSALKLVSEVQQLNALGDLKEVIQSDFSSSSPAKEMTSESPSSSRTRDTGEANSTGSSEHANDSDSTRENSTACPESGADE